MKLKNHISFLMLLFLSNSILAQVKDNEILSKTKNGIPKMIRFEQTKISSDKNSVISFLKEQYKTDSQMEFKPSKIEGKERKVFTSQKRHPFWQKSFP